MCLPSAERCFQEHQWSALLFSAEITQILLFSGMLLLERSKITYWKRQLFQTNCIEALGICLSYIKKYFQEHQWSDFLFVAHITQLLLFSGILLLERSRTTIWKRHIFKKKKENAIRSFTHVPPLHKRVFSRSRVKCFSLYSSNDLDYAVFRNAAFEEIKDHRLKKTPIQKKKMLFEVLGMCLPCIKRYFQEQNRSAFLFMAQMT